MKIHWTIFRLLSKVLDERSCGSLLFRMTCLGYIGKSGDLNKIGFNA